MTPNYSFLTREELLLVAYGLWEQIEELRREIEGLRGGFEDWKPGMKLELGDRVRIMGEVMEVTVVDCFEIWEPEKKYVAGEIVEDVDDEGNVCLYESLMGGGVRRVHNIPKNKFLAAIWDIGRTLGIIEVRFTEEEFFNVGNRPSLCPCEWIGLPAVKELSGVNY